MKKRLEKKLQKQNLLLSNEIASKMKIEEKDVLQVDENGKVLLDFNNPNHVKIYERWMQD